MNKGILILLTAVLGVITGCGQQVAFTGSPASPASESQGGLSTNPIDVADDVPLCEIDIPQVELQGNLNAFEFSSGGGITFGYNANGFDPGIGGSASVMISSSQMDMTYVAVDPMMSTVLGSTEVTASQTKTNIGVTIDFSLWSLSPSYASSTPLATMTLKGLTTAVGNIKTQTDKIPWVGRVIYHNADGTLTINAGTQNGIVAGDVYNLQNVTHFWSGTPCSSTYEGFTPDDATPEATLKIVTVGPNAATGVLTVLNANNHIRQGAEVLVNTLVAAAKGAPARYLEKNAVLGQITAEPINLPGGATFNFASVMNSQDITVVNSSGGYVFQTP